MSKNRAMTTKTTTKKSDPKRLSFAAIAVYGVFCAALLFASWLAIRHIHSLFSPTARSSERLLAKGKPQEALARLDRIPDSEKRGDARAQLARGRALFAVLMEQLREERWASYGKNPNNWLAHPLADEAEKCFLDAMAISPNDPEIRLVLGNLYREQGRFADAEIILRSVLEIDERNAEAFLALGLLYAEGGRLPAAKRALALAWEHDEGNPKISKNIGYFYRFYEDVPESSIVWLNRYLDANPRRDPAINFVRSELRNLYERYPEFGVYDRDPPMPNRGVGRTFVNRPKK